MLPPSVTDKAEAVRVTVVGSTVSVIEVTAGVLSTERLMLPPEVLAMEALTEVASR